MIELRLQSSPLRETRAARIWAPLVTFALFAVLPFVYVHLWATFFGARPELDAVQPSYRVWLAFAVVQVANKLPIAYRYTPGPAVAALDLLGFSAGLLAVVALGAGAAVPTGIVRTAWLLVVVVWLVASAWHQLNPHSPQNQGVGLWHRLFCSLVATLIPGLPFAFAVLAAPAA